MDQTAIGQLHYVYIWTFDRLLGIITKNVEK